MHFKDVAMLKDGFGRVLDYLRVSITDKCNLRCIYCMPPQGVDLLAHDEVLRNEEFVDIIRIFTELGIKKIRFTGGEPLVRKGFQDIIMATRELAPDVDLCLTTNGLLLDGALEYLRECEVKRLNISLDTVSDERYRRITGRDCFSRVIANIEKAVSYGWFDIKINSVLFEQSLDEIDALLDYFKDKNVSLRFIERMPFVAEDADYTYLPSDRLIEVLKMKGSLERNRTIDTNVAMMYTLQYRGIYPIRIGVIPPMSHKFCACCNRLRLTCDGKLKTCLYSQVEYDLKKIIRTNGSDDEMRGIIQTSILHKPKEHEIKPGLGGDDGCSALVNGRTMSRIGG